MNTQLTLTQDQAEALDGILKARIFDMEFKADRRNTSKLQKEIYAEQVSLLKAIVAQLAQ